MRHASTLLTATLTAAITLGTVGCSAGVGSVDSAKVNTCSNEKATIETAVEAYFATDGSYPAAIADMVGPDKQLKDDPSARWTYTLDGSTYTLTGIGDCATQNP